MFSNFISTDFCLHNYKLIHFISKKRPAWLSVIAADWLCVETCALCGNLTAAKSTSLAFLQQATRETKRRETFRKTLPLLPPDTQLGPGRLGPLWGSKRSTGDAECCWLPSHLTERCPPRWSLGNCCPLVQGAWHCLSMFRKNVVKLFEHDIPQTPSTDMQQLGTQAKLTNTHNAKFPTRHQKKQYLSGPSWPWTLWESGLSQKGTVR